MALADFLKVCFTHFFCLFFYLKITVLNSGVWKGGVEGYQQPLKSKNVKASPPNWFYTPLGELLCTPLVLNNWINKHKIANKNN